MAKLVKPKRKLAESGRVLTLDANSFLNQQTSKQKKNKPTKQQHQQHPTSTWWRTSSDHISVGKYFLNDVRKEVWLREKERERERRKVDRLNGGTN